MRKAVSKRAVVGASGSVCHSGRKRLTMGRAIESPDVLSDVLPQTVLGKAGTASGP